ATKSAFPNQDEWELTPTTTIREVFDEVQASNVDFGVAPFENSTHGTVSFTLDCLADRLATYPNITICGEAYLDVHHFLLGRRKSPLLSNIDDEKSAKATPLTSLSHVKRVYSHPQAFGQTAKFFATYLKGVETIEVSSTSKAAELAAADATGSSAAVAGEVAGEMVGLDVLARCIEDREDNTTRFFVLRRRPCSSRSDDGVEQEFSLPEGLPWTTDRAESLLASEAASSSSARSGSPVSATSGSGNGDDATAEKADAYKGLYKSMVSFTVPHHTPGALADVLGCFKRRGLNLTSINSLPSLIAPFQYLFFVEFEGSRWDDPEGRVSGLVGDVEWVEGVAERWRWLGSWLNQRRR
ncbi:Prephenate dehydratase-domain-containing protein, partial [Sordaria brevicollis]